MTLGTYLDDASRRLKQRFTARGVAAIGLVTLLLTALLAYALVTFVPTSVWVVAARIMLYGMLLLAALGLLRFGFS